MELVPHITLNPSFNIDMLEYIEPTETSPTIEYPVIAGDDAQDRINLVENHRRITSMLEHTG